MKGNEDVLDQKIWGLLSGQLQDRKEIGQVAQILNDQFIPRVMGVLKRLGVDEITAEGIAKEAVDKAIKTFRPGKAKFLTFVTKIALHIRIDRFRRGLLPALALYSIDDESLELQERLSNSEIPAIEDDRPERSEFMRKIDSVMHLMTQEDRLLIQLDIQSVPKESYMEIFDISEGTYRQRKSRAYHRLRELFDRQESE